MACGGIMSLIPGTNFKAYRLHNGSIGTEYQAILESIESLEVRKKDLEFRIYDLRKQLPNSEGNPEK